MTHKKKWLTAIVTFGLLALLFFVAWGEVLARDVSPAILVPIFIAPITVLIVILSSNNQAQMPQPPQGRADHYDLIDRLVDEVDDDERAYLRRVIDPDKDKRT